MPPKKTSVRLGSGRECCVAPPTESEEEARKKLLEEIYNDYVATFEQNKDESARQTASTDWFVTHADRWYPGIGTRPLAIPIYFTGRYQAALPWEKKYSVENLKAEAENAAGKVTKNIIKGDRSQRLVGRAFRILSGLLKEAEGGPMMVISQYHFDNILGFLRRPSTAKTPESPKTKKKGAGKATALVPDEVLKKLKERGETDLMILHRDKGVVFVQIKGVGDKKRAAGDNSDSDPDSRYEDTEDTMMSAIGKARKQLLKDVELFQLIMGRPVPGCQLTQVIAVPNMSAEQIRTLTANDDDYKDIRFLCEDDMFKDDATVSESGTDLGCFRDWWNKISTQKKKMDIDTMKEIVGRYVGPPLSTATTFAKGSEMTFYRSLRESIFHTWRLYRRVVLSPAQLRILEDLQETGGGEGTGDYLRNYLSGPPCSDKTLLMTLSCRAFLAEDLSHQAVVVNMFRGAKGRAIGHHIHKEVTAGDSFKGRVHLLNVDVGDLTQKQFTTEVKKCFKGQDSELMFVIVEVYAESFWSEVLKALKKDFPLSRVVCAGLFSATPTGFTERRLDLVHRCPPAVQNLLYQVDWDETRKRAYVRDCGYHRALSTNGPPPLCVRHIDHEGPPGVMDCQRCGAELADVLLPLVGKSAGGDQACAATELADILMPFVGKSAGGDQACAATAAEPYDVPADMKMAILVNMPKERYHETRHDNYVETTDPDYHGYMKDVSCCPLETTDDDYRSYMRYVSRCPLVSTLVTKLRARGLDVHLELDLAPTDLHEDALPSPFLTWLYNFQGLEAAVVVYLPGDPSPPEGAGEGGAASLAQGGTGCPPKGGARPRPQKGHGDGLKSLSLQGKKTLREIPTPRVRKDGSRKHPASSSEVPTVGKTEGGDGDGAGAGAGDGARQWTRADVQRYSRWDQTNILVAGSGCLCQLVLVVP